MTTKLGKLDGNPAKWTDSEGFWLVDGNWLPIDPVEAMVNAAMMTEEEFLDEFGHLPALPSTAFQS